MLDNPWFYEREAHARGYAVVCGVDEAGRGPLAGDVFAAACILPEDFDTAGLDDSKKLSPKKRDALYDRIKAGAIAFAVARVSAEEIDRINILNAAMTAMHHAIDALSVRPDYALVDGDKLRGFTVPAECIVQGDGKSASIAAASILAKVERDRYMLEMAKRYPGYGFEKHKGYGTKAHYDAIASLGVCEIHRKTFLKKIHTPEIPRLTEDERQLAGKYGEDCAARFLEGLGYTILARNYRTRDGELDIVARDGNEIVFAEVKERQSDVFGSGVEGVTEEKVACLKKCAEAWLAENAPQSRSRFDVVEVNCGTPRQSPFGLTFPPPRIRHFKAAV